MNWGSIEVAHRAERKYEMKRLLTTIVIAGVFFNTGLTFAQGPMPEKVRTFVQGLPEKVRKALEWKVGTWDLFVKEHNVKGQLVYKWSPAKFCLIGHGQVMSRDFTINHMEFWTWDGKSDDGVTIQWVKRNANISKICRMVSDTVREGKSTGIRLGKKSSFKVKEVREGEDKFTIYSTERILDGKPQSDQTVVFTRVKTTSDEQELTELYRVWLNAALKNDAATIGRLLADDFICGMTNGEILTKAPYLAEITSGDYQVTSMREDALKVRVYGDMALVTCIWTEKSQTKGADTSGQYCSTDTWTKRYGRWQCVAEHISKVAETTNDN
jgi:ketosteroid isomerase-like protein